MLGLRIVTGAMPVYGQFRPQYQLQQKPTFSGSSPSIDDVDDSVAMKAMLTKSFLRELGNKPRVHPNGFIQLDLSPTRRLHIWGHPDIPKAVEEACIHDHVFGFRSWALAGSLTNIVYELDYEGNDYEIYDPRITQGHDGVLTPTGVRCSLKKKRRDRITARDQHSQDPDTYTIAPYEFHGTEVSGPAATVIEKTGETLAENPSGPKPRVLMPVGSTFDHSDFSRYDADEQLLWRIIDEVLGVT